MKRTAQVPVMIPPMGKIMIFCPGRTKRVPTAGTRVWIGGTTRDLVAVTEVAKMPLTKVASWEERVVFTTAPVGSVAVKVTAGTRIFWRAALYSC